MDKEPPLPLYIFYLLVKNSSVLGSNERKYFQIPQSMNKNLFSKYPIDLIKLPIPHPRRGRKEFGCGGAKSSRVIRHLLSPVACGESIQVTFHSFATLGYRAALGRNAGGFNRYFTINTTRKRIFNNL